MFIITFKSDDSFSEVETFYFKSLEELHEYLKKTNITNDTLLTIKYYLK